MYGKKQHKIHEGLRRQIWEPDYNSSSPLTDYKTNFACFDLFLAQLIIPMLDGSQTLCLLQESMKSCSKQYHWYLSLYTILHYSMVGSIMVPH